MARTVTGRLVKSNTSPIKNVYIYFRPLAIMAYTTSNDMVSLEPIEVVTDVNGEFTTTLYSIDDFDSDSSEYIFDKMGYRIEIPTLGLVRNVIVPEGTTTIDWNSLTNLES
jgi:hypothetical protein